jgi:hypothetical protein
MGLDSKSSLDRLAKFSFAYLIGTGRGTADRRHRETPGRANQYRFSSRAFGSKSDPSSKRMAGMMQLDAQDGDFRRLKKV